MTKEITKAIILQAIQDKFQLREFEPAKFLFDETVIPVYNIEPHLKAWTSAFHEETITASGPVIFYTVPDNERWSLRRYDVVFMGVATCTIAGLFVNRSIGENVYLDLAAAQTVSYHIDLLNPVILEPNDKVDLNVDGYTSSVAIRVYIDYMKEEIR